MTKKNPQHADAAARAADRPTISETQPDGLLRLAVQKSGRLSEGSTSLLRQMGLQFETYSDRLFARCRNMPVNILFLRDDDIPEYVQDGVADLGIVGGNVLDERAVTVDRLLPLDFGYCSLCLAVPEPAGRTARKTSTANGSPLRIPRRCGAISATARSRPRSSFSTGASKSPRPCKSPTPCAIWFRPAARFGRTG